MASNSDEIERLTGVSIVLRPPVEGVAFSFDWLTDESRNSSRWMGGGVGYVLRLVESERLDIRARPGVALVHFSQEGRDIDPPWLAAATGDVELMVPIIGRLSGLLGVGGMMSIPLQGRRRVDTVGMRAGRDVVFGTFESYFLAARVSAGLLYVAPIR